MIEISIHTKPGTKILVNKFEITPGMEGPWAVLEIQGEGGGVARVFLSDLSLVEGLTRALEEIRVHLSSLRGEREGWTPPPVQELGPQGRSESFAPQGMVEIQDEDEEGRARAYWSTLDPPELEEILGEDTRQSLRDLSGAEEWYV